MPIGSLRPLRLHSPICQYIYGLHYHGLVYCLPPNLPSRMSFQIAKMYIIMSVHWPLLEKLSLARVVVRLRGIFPSTKHSTYITELANLAASNTLKSSVSISFRQLAFV